MKGNVDVLLEIEEASGGSNESGKGKTKANEDGKSELILAELRGKEVKRATGIARRVRFVSPDVKFSEFRHSHDSASKISRTQSTHPAGGPDPPTAGPSEGNPSADETKSSFEPEGAFILGKREVAKMWLKSLKCVQEILRRSGESSKRSVALDIALAPLIPALRDQLLQEDSRAQLKSCNFGFLPASLNDSYLSCARKTNAASLGSGSSK